MQDSIKFALPCSHNMGGSHILVNHSRLNFTVNLQSFLFSGNFLSVTGGKLKITKPIENCTFRLCWWYDYEIFVTDQTSVSSLYGLTRNWNRFRLTHELLFIWNHSISVWRNWRCLMVASSAITSWSDLLQTWRYYIYMYNTSKMERLYHVISMTFKVPRTPYCWPIPQNALVTKQRIEFIAPAHEVAFFQRTLSRGGQMLVGRKFRLAS